MDNKTATQLFSLLGNDIRLSIFRMLIQAGDSGIRPKQMSDQLKIEPNGLSFHLNKLKELALINNKKSGRELIYYANYKIIEGLVDYLFENCCNGDTKKCFNGLCNTNS